MNRISKIIFAASLCVASIGIGTAYSMGEVPKSAAVIESKSVEDNQQRLLKNYPAPKLQYSLERENLIKRLETLNSPNMSGYIYLLSHGQVQAFYSVRGKVTSLNAYLMAGERVVYDRGELGGGNLTIEQPDYDGAYGENDKGIFFFTSEGIYVEWKGEYLFSNQPLQLRQQPLMTREVK